ncbi:MAG: nicotinate-nucleotide adenylyltransferase [Aquabacterium sp.]
MDPTRPRIGLLGGSFDPPHLAHLALALCAQDALALDELRWLPAGQPWQKAGRPMTDGAHRLAMVQLLMHGRPRMSVDDRELRRQGASYTIDTVLELSAEQPTAQWILILGQDQYARLHTWHRWRELLPLVTLAVAARSGAAARPEPEVAAVAHRQQMISMPRLDIAATDLRRLAARGEKLEPLVGPAAAGYIARHGLYRMEASGN